MPWRLSICQTWLCMPVLTTTLYKPSNKTGLPFSRVEKKKMFCEVAKQLITCVVLYSQSPEPANVCIPNDIFREHLSYTACPCYCATLPSYKILSRKPLIKTSSGIASTSTLQIHQSTSSMASAVHLPPLTPPHPPEKKIATTFMLLIWIGNASSGFEIQSVFVTLFKNAPSCSWRWTFKQCILVP